MNKTFKKQLFVSEIHHTVVFCKYFMDQFGSASSMSSKTKMFHFLINAFCLTLIG